MKTKLQEQIVLKPIKDLIRNNIGINLRGI